jgi:hypothetical protein
VPSHLSGRSIVTSARAGLKCRPVSGLVRGGIVAGHDSIPARNRVELADRGVPTGERRHSSSVQIETGGYKLRRWTETTHRILQGRKVVGVVTLSETDGSRTDVLAEFASSKQTINNIKALRLPTQFNYTWVEVIKIGESSRGHGYGTQIFDWIKATRRGTLLGLNPQEIAADCPIETILRFYRKQGFQLSRFDNEWYGFLYLP